MFAVVAIAAVGWLVLFMVLLAAPPPRRARPTGPGGEAAPVAPHPGDEPPAVVSLLAGQLGKSGFGATLVDLASRGWFRVSAPAGPDGWTSAGQAGGPVMCVLPAERPDGPLTPFERRVVAHLALRAGARGEVPAAALADGFEGGKSEYMKAFGDEVVADARQRGLIRSRLSPGRIGLLCTLLLIPAGALLPAIEGSRHHSALAFLGLGYLTCSGFIIQIGTSRRRTAAGRKALSRWRAAVGAPGDGRRLAYAAALGTAPAAIAVFAPAGQNLLWSSYRGSWQQIAVEGSTWSWPQTWTLLLATIFAPVLYVGGVIWLFSHGLAALALMAIGLVVVGPAAGTVVWLARRTLFPRFAEFDGQVLRQTVTSSSDSPDEYRVVIDDGVRPMAWNLEVGSGPYGLLTPGTFVHVRVNLHNREQVIVQPVEPPAVAGPLADVAAGQRQADTGGLPDPGVLVTAGEAAAVFGGPVQRHHISSPAGRATSWQLTGTVSPSLRIDVRGTIRSPSGLSPAQIGWPVPGVTGGYLMGSKAVLYAGPWTVILSIRGTVPAGNEATLVHLLPLVAGRL